MKPASPLYNVIRIKVMAITKAENKSEIQKKLSLDKHLVLNTETNLNIKSYKGDSNEKTI